MKRTILFFVTLLFACSSAFSQKVIKASGSLEALKGEKVFNLKYSYDNLIVGKKKEADYINEKVREYNSKEKGKGDGWKEAWYNDRVTRYHPKFEELFNKYISGNGMSASVDNDEAKYTIHIKTTWIEPGWNIGISRSSAYINVSIEIYETKKPDSLTARFSVNKIPGSDAMGYDFDSGLRISEAYAKLGKIFGKYLVKNLK